MIPITFHSAIAIACSILIFPETVTMQFAKNLKEVFEPLRQGIEGQPELLAQTALSEDLDPTPFVKKVAGAEGALAALGGSARLMERDLSWGMFGSRDLKGFRALAERLVVSAQTAQRDLPRL